MLNGQHPSTQLAEPLQVPPGCMALPVELDGSVKAPKIECIPVMAREVANANVEKSRALGHINFLHLPEVGRRKDCPIAIVAGGPSTRDHLERIRTFRTIMSASTVHDYLIERGIFPRYHVMFDPTPHANGDPALGSNMGYFNRLCSTCTYLISSHSDAAIFQHFAEVPVAVWHAAGDIDEKIVPGEGAITGGCTAALRAISMAIIMGYWDIHLFGLDSCFSGEDSHAYPQNEPLSQRVQVKIEETGQAFDTTVAWIAQAQQFFNMLQAHHGKFRPTVYGDGLIAAMWRQMQRPAALK